MNIWGKIKNVFTRKVEPPTRSPLPKVEIIPRSPTKNTNKDRRNRKPKEKGRPFENYAKNLLNKIRLGEKRLTKAQESLNDDIKKLTEAMKNMGPDERAEARHLKKSAKKLVDPYTSKLKKDIKNFVQKEPDRSDLFENMFLSPRLGLEGYHKRVQKE